MRIAVPTTLVWGRHDLQTPLSVAEAASARYGWPLYVIEGARDDPFFEQPEAGIIYVREHHAAGADSQYHEVRIYFGMHREQRCNDTRRGETSNSCGANAYANDASDQPAKE